MDVKKSFTRKNDNTGVYVSYNTIEECPNCKKALAPQHLLYSLSFQQRNKKINIFQLISSLTSLWCDDYIFWSG